MSEEEFMNCLSEIHYFLDRSNLSTINDILLCPRGSAWPNIFSINACRIKKNFKGDDDLIHDETCTFIDSLSSRHRITYISYMVINNYTINDSKK